MLPSVVTILTSGPLLSLEGPAIQENIGAGADIALLRLIEANANLPHAAPGDSDVLAVGQSTYVIGSPFGLERSFSIGHISAFREFDRLYDGSIVVEFIQTDAAINSGNSGGAVPLLLLRQEILLGGLDRIRVRYLRGGKRLETEVDVSSARQNFLHSE